MESWCLPYRKLALGVSLAGFLLTEWDSEETRGTVRRPVRERQRVAVAAGLEGGGGPGCMLMCVHIWFDAHLPLSWNSSQASSKRFFVSTLHSALWIMQEVSMKGYSLIWSLEEQKWAPGRRPEWGSLSWQPRAGALTANGKSLEGFHQRGRASSVTARAEMLTSVRGL